MVANMAEPKNKKEIIDALINKLNNKIKEAAIQYFSDSKALQDLYIAIVTNSISRELKRYKEQFLDDEESLSLLKKSLKETRLEVEQIKYRIEYQAVNQIFASSKAFNKDTFINETITKYISQINQGGKTPSNLSPVFYKLSLTYTTITEQARRPIPFDEKQEELIKLLEKELFRVNINKFGLFMSSKKTHEKIVTLHQALEKAKKLKTFEELYLLMDIIMTTPEITQARNIFALSKSSSTTKNSLLNFKKSLPSIK